MSQTLAFCESRRVWLLETIDALVRLESPSTDPAAVNHCVDVVGRLLSDRGGRVRRQPGEGTGDHLVAEFGDAASPVLLLGHTDTVWPVGQIERMPLVVRDGRLHGPGVFDMKAGIAIAVLAIEALAAGGRDRPGVIVLLTADEETGSRASRALIEATARRCRAVLVLEPALPGGAVKTARKGCGTFELVVRGVAAHAGIEPHKGANAVLELAAQLLALDGCQDLERGTSIAPCVVAGGCRTNVVPDEARAILDIRVMSADEADRVRAVLQGLQPGRSGTSLVVAGGFDRPPLERTAEVLRLYTLARGVAAELGQELAEGATGGASDGNFTAALGVPTLDGLGAMGDGAHATHEHVLVEALAPRAALLAGLIRRLLDEPSPMDDTGFQARAG